MREALSVDQVQKIVAKPIARPVLVARDQLHAVELRARDQLAREGEQLLVGGVHLVEVAVAAHERQQLG